MDTKDTPRFDGKNLVDEDGNALNLKDKEAREALKKRVPATSTWRKYHG